MLLFSTEGNKQSMIQSPLREKASAGIKV